MLKSLTFLSLAATFSLANAQAADPVTPPQQSAPIVRSYQQQRSRHQAEQLVESQPTAGVWLRSEASSVLTTVSATPQHTEIRLDHGRLNVTIHQPVQHSEILIDLPGGQTSTSPVSPLQVSLLKDGLYTFNADTNTVRVLRGEAAYVSPSDANAKPIKIKEDHQLSLVAATGEKPASVESYPYELTADLLRQDNHGEPGYAQGGDYPRYEPYPYYAGFYDYPGYYGFGYPFSYGVGLGYYGGFGGFGGYGGYGGYRGFGGFGGRGGFRR